MPPRRPLRVLVSGASGLVGTELIRQLRRDGHSVRTLVRHESTADDQVAWSPKRAFIAEGAFDGVDAVVNLSGASVGRIPWTSSYKKTLVDSRVVPTRVLAEAMGALRTPPKVFISASAVGFYGDRPGVRLTESSAAGTGFFPDLVEAWEAASRLAPAKTRVVNPRTAVVVAKAGGLAPVRLLTMFGAGARFGTGGQYWPWIALYDEAAAIRHLITSKLEGPVNLAGPVPATSDRVTHDYARSLGRPYLFTVPEPLVRMLGEAGERLLLDSAQVIPEKLEADGFEWRFRTVEQAIAAALGREPMDPPPPRPVRRRRAPAPKPLEPAPVEVAPAEVVKPAPVRKAPTAKAPAAKPPAVKAPAANVSAVTAPAAKAPPAKKPAPKRTPATPKGEGG